MAELKAMYRDWPFFQSMIDLIEMILAKADMRIAELYDEVRGICLWGGWVDTAACFHVVPIPESATSTMKRASVLSTWQSAPTTAPRSCRTPLPLSNNTPQTTIRARALTCASSTHMHKTNANTPHAHMHTQVLVTDPAERELGEHLRARYRATVAAIQQVTGHSRLCANNPTLRRLIEMRAPYVDPINMMQVEILNRLRKDPTNDRLRDALLISINGIAAGMRNTG